MSAIISFHEIRLPLRLAYGSIAGVESHTDIAAMASGFEQRNSRWARVRRKYNIAAGPRPISELVELLAFFEARGGRLYGFRWQDWLDYKSCAMNVDVSASDTTPLALGEDGKKFQLQKTYVSGTSTITRRITKPVAGSVKVAVDGMEIDADDFTLDSTTGIFELNEAASDVTSVTAGYEFDVPVRFDIDHLEIEYAAHDAGRINAVPLIELRLDD